MYIPFAHAGEAHESSGQSFIHIIAAWYVLVPLFTILVTVIVALAVRQALDYFDKRKPTKNSSHPKTDKPAPKNRKESD
jgi:phosphate/sulfate permease